MPRTIQLRRGTAAAWSSANPTLKIGEVGLVVNAVGRIVDIKVGDGVSAWNNLRAMFDMDGTTTAPPAPAPTPVADKLMTVVGNKIHYGGVRHNFNGVNLNPFDAVTIEGGNYRSQQLDRVKTHIDYIRTLLPRTNMIRMNIQPGAYKAFRNQVWFHGFCTTITDYAIQKGFFVLWSYQAVAFPGQPDSASNFTVDAYLSPIYDPDIAICKEWIVYAAGKWGNDHRVALLLWDEPTASTAPGDLAGSTNQWRNVWEECQDLLTHARNAGWTGLLGIFGGHYARDYSSYQTFPITDPLNRFFFSRNEFTSGEPQTYLAMTTSSGTRMDSLFPFLFTGLGGIDKNGVPGPTDPGDVVLTTEQTNNWNAFYEHVINNEFDGSAGQLAWNWTTHARPFMIEPVDTSPAGRSFPIDGAPKLTRMGIYFRDNFDYAYCYLPDGTLPSFEPPPPSPPSPPPPVTGFVPDIYIDPQNGNDANSGLTSALPKKTWTGADAIITANKKVGFLAGSIHNSPVVIGNNAKYNGLTIGTYGTGARAVIRNSLYLTYWVNAGGNLWWAPQGSLGKITPFTALGNNGPTRITSMLKTYTNPARWVNWHVNSQAEVNEEHKFYHDEAAGRVYIYSTTTPGAVEVGISTPVKLTQPQNVRIQGLDVAMSRDNGIEVDRPGPNLQIVDCKVAHCGVSGIYVLTRSTATSDGITAGLTIDNNVITNVHACGIVVSAAEGGVNPNKCTNISVDGNNISFACMGPPFLIPAGGFAYTADDYYSAEVKFYAGNHSKASWGWTGTVNNNTLSDAGDPNNVYQADSGLFIWLDTVNGTIEVTGNVGTRARTAGYLVEMSPEGEHDIHHNVAINTGYANAGYSAALTANRGTRQAKFRYNTVVNANQAACAIYSAPGNGGGQAEFNAPQRVSDCIFENNILHCLPNVPAIWEVRGDGSGNIFRNNWIGADRTRIGGYRLTANYNVDYHNTFAAWRAAAGRAADGQVTGAITLVAIPTDLRPTAGNVAATASTAGTQIGALAAAT